MTDAAHNPSTYNASYTYSVPEVISSSGGVVHLEVTANDVSNDSGLDAQVCEQSPFPLTADSGTDPCAHAFAKTPGSSATGSKDLTLLPSGVTPSQLCPNGGPGSQPECVQLMIELGDGGNLIFTYQASPAPKITYSFHATYVHPVTHTTVEVRGSGNFQLAGPLEEGCAEGTNDHGSMVVRIHKRNRVFSVELNSFEAKNYCMSASGNERHVTVMYRVAKSVVGCLPDGAKVDIFARARHRGGDNLVPDFCRLHGFDEKHAPSVTINSS